MCKNELSSEQVVKIVQEIGYMIVQVKVKLYTIKNAPFKSMTKYIYIYCSVALVNVFTVQHSYIYIDGLMAFKSEMHHKKQWPVPIYHRSVGGTTWSQIVTNSKTSACLRYVRFASEIDISTRPTSFLADLVFKPCLLYEQFLILL